MMAACCGIENNLGQLITPLRNCYDKAENDFLGDLPDLYIEVVMAYNADGVLNTGFYAGDDQDTYLMGPSLASAEYHNRSPLKRWSQSCRG